jgi:hypothetical protein
MNHRKTLGFESDVAESAALTIADERATERIYEACDWEENPESIDTGNGIDLSDEQCIHAAVERVRRALGNKCARVVNAYLNHKNWEDLNIPERTFQHALKKIKIYFHADK